MDTWSDKSFFSPSSAKKGWRRGGGRDTGSETFFDIDGPFPGKGRDAEGVFR